MAIDNQQGTNPGANQQEQNTTNTTPNVVVPQVNIPGVPHMPQPNPQQPTQTPQNSTQPTISTTPTQATQLPQQSQQPQQQAQQHIPQGQPLPGQTQATGPTAQYTQQQPLNQPHITNTMGQPGQIPQDQTPGQNIQQRTQNQQNPQQGFPNTMPPQPQNIQQNMQQNIQQNMNTQGGVYQQPGIAGTVPQAPLQVVKGSTQQQKKGKKITMKGFLIGCGIFLIVIAGLASLVFYYLLSNPDQIGSVMPLETVQQLLQTFVALFFGFLFFLGFGFVVLNGYRLATVKDAPKGGFAGGLVLGIIIVVASIAGGMILLQRIGEIAGQQVQQSNNIINVLVPFADGDRYHHSLSTPLIAPASIAYEINQTVLQRTLPSIIQTDTLTAISLDCGNGQILTLGDQGFNRRCLYQQKGTYNLIATLTHVDRATGEERQTPVSLPSLNFATELSVSTSAGAYTLSDAQDEMIVGKAPVKMLFDANSMFSDLGLANTRIRWDLDNDGQIDEERDNDASLAYQLIEDKLHTISYQLPEIGPLRYSIQVRVLQSDVPICQVSLSPRQDTLYNINTIFQDNQTPIEDYVFRILKNGQEVENIRSQQPQVNHDFVHGVGNYVVRVDFVTDEGKTGSCESDDLPLGETEYRVDYALEYKTSQSPEYRTINGEGDVYMEDETIIVRQVPSYIKVTIGQISPRKESTSLKLLVNGSPTVALRENVYEIAINQNQDYNIAIVVSDTGGAETRIPLSLQVKQDSIRGSLVALPDSVGTEPFTVTLDASATQVTDPNDKIVYFTRDFGDGRIETNTTLGQVDHTYTYDYDNDNGQYNPSVTIITQRGREQTIALESPLFVQKGQQDIQMRSSSHPSQRATIGDTVEFTILSDGQIQEIERDFGNGETPFICESRSCTDMTYSYTASGEYAVKAKVTYTNGTVSHAAMNMIIN